jgi:hypothetical protein
LKQKLSSLALPLPEAAKSSIIASQISGKTYDLEPNDIPGDNELPVYGKYVQSFHDD